MNTQDVKKIAVIGAGDMGHGIAACFLIAGYTVTLRDIQQAFVDRGVIGIRKSFEKFVAKGKMTSEAYAEAMNRLICTVEMKEAVQDADFIIEAVPEKMEIKKSVFEDLDRYAPSHAILASNTSNMSISKIAKATGREDRVIGYHFFNPAILMKLVEVIKGDATSDAAVQVGYDLAKKIGKVPVIVEKDSPSFIYNRVNAPACALLNKIVEAGNPSPEAFDAALKAFMPMGLFELSDYVGNDINVHGLMYMAEALSPEYRPCEAFLKMIEENKLGKKTGRGFYDWSAGRPQIDPGKATLEYDINHLIALQVNEATKLLDEGVCSDPKQIDLAMVNGGGSPLGPFALAKSCGYPTLISKLEELHDRFNLDIFKPTETMRKGDITV